MKKVFLIALLALLPLTAHAQSSGDQVIQAAADELKPAFCANDLKQAIQIVEGCYAKVDEDSENSNMNLCVVEDIFVMNIIDAKRKMYLNDFQTDPYINLDFANMMNMILRWSKHPNFMSNVTNLQDGQRVGKRVGTDILSILRQEGCFDFNKLE